MTSRICRSPASNTSSTICRSSAPSVSDPETSSRISASVICSRCAPGSPPTSRTTTLVDADSSQMTGRASLAIRSTVGATASEIDSARCSASRLGASSPTTSDTYEMNSVMRTSARRVGDTG